MESEEKSGKIGILKYNLEDPSAREEMIMAINVLKYKFCIEELWDQMMRPHYKHGFSNQRINELLEEFGEKGDELMSLLADIYNRVIMEEISEL